MSKIISMLQLKGGIGKSTLTISIAGVLASKGHKILIIDADAPQCTVAAWHTLQNDPLIDIAVANNAAELNNIVQGAFGKVDFILIDSPPRMNELQRGILMLSDNIIVPVQTNPADLWAFDDLYLLISEAKESGSQAKFKLLWNKFKNYPVPTQIRADVVEQYGFDQFENSMSELTGYGQMIGEGKHPLNFANWRTKRQFKLLSQEILNYLDA